MSVNIFIKKLIHKYVHVISVYGFYNYKHILSCKIRSPRNRSPTYGTQMRSTFKEKLFEARAFTVYLNERPAFREIFLNRSRLKVAAEDLLSEVTPFGGADGGKRS